MISDYSHDYVGAMVYRLIYMGQPSTTFWHSYFDLKDFYFSHWALGIDTGPALCIIILVRLQIDFQTKYNLRSRGGSGLFKVVISLIPIETNCGVVSLLYGIISN